MPARAATSVTLTSSHTAAGVVMGTASYMAPEQVRGEAADARTDIFAFGAVLYEMLSGNAGVSAGHCGRDDDRGVEGGSAGVVGSGPAVSPALDRIVRRCLEKSPEQRFQSARDLSFALSALSGSEAERLPEQRGCGWAEPDSGLSLDCGLVAAAGGGGRCTWFGAAPAQPLKRMEFAIPVPEE